MRAIFQGEYHVSSVDRKALSEQVDGDIDAVFQEGREDRVEPELWSLGYVAFVSGVLLLSWFQAKFDTGPEIEEEVDIPVHDEIDSDLPELYKRFPRSWTWVLGTAALLLLLSGVHLPTLAIPVVEAPQSLDRLYGVAAKTLFTLGGPLLFTFLLILLEEQYIGSRDEDIADNITELTQQNEYEVVVVSCGDAHLDRLPDLLSDRGWEVEVNESRYSFVSRLFT